jgi:hypothetical protein
MAEARGKRPVPWFQLMPDNPPRPAGRSYPERLPKVTPRRRRAMLSPAE